MAENLPLLHGNAIGFNYGPINQSFSLPKLSKGNYRTTYIYTFSVIPFYFLIKYIDDRNITRNYENNNFKRETITSSCFVFTFLYFNNFVILKQHLLEKQSNNNTIENPYGCGQNNFLQKLISTERFFDLFRFQQLRF